MARQQRLTGDRAATTRLHFGGAAARAAGAGPRGMRLPRRCDGEHPGPTTRGVPEAAGAPSGEADAAARRRTRTAAPEHFFGSVDATDGPRRDDPKPTASRLPAKGVGAHRRSRPLGVGGDEALPGRQAHPARAGQTQQRSEPIPGGRREPADASHAEGWVQAQAPRHGSFGSQAGGRGMTRGAATSTARHQGCQTRSRSADDGLRSGTRRRCLKSCTLGDGWSAARGIQRCRASRGNPDGDIEARYGHSFGSGPAPPTSATRAREGRVSSTSGHRRARGSGTSVRQSR